MTQPVLITTHNNNGITTHHAWSPLMFDINIIADHPLVHPDYQNFVNRVMNRINEEMLGEVYHTHTEFHSNVYINNRGLHAYFSVSFDHVVSPVFFNQNQIHTYVNQFPGHNTIYVAQHHLILI
jgi:hypothetical protein